MTRDELPGVLRQAAEIVGADAKPMLRELLLAAAEELERLRGNQDAPHEATGEGLAGRQEIG